MLNNTPAQYKKEYPWLKEVGSLALVNAQMNLNKAYRSFFRDKSVSFPKFKSKKRNRYSYTTNNQKGTIYIEDKYIKLPKLKSIIKIPSTVILVPTFMSLPNCLMARLNLVQYQKHLLTNTIYLY